jgi:hypothetical protein
MYGHGFQDLDGHIWELIYMDPSAIKQGSRSRNLSEENEDGIRRRFRASSPEEKRAGLPAHGEQVP